MAYIGRSVDIGMFEKQVLTPDSSTTTFTLTYAVGSANSLLVVYGGVVQEPQVAYSVSGGGQSIAFSEAPATGTTTYIIYLGKQLTTPRAAGQETTKQTFSGDGSTTLFTLTDPPVVPAGIMVFVDGILQREGSGNNYVSSGSTITFTAAPDNGAEIDVYTLVKEKVSIDTVANGSITSAKMAASFPTWDSSGNFTFPLTGSRIRGDFSNASLASRVLFQTSTTNGITTLGVLPNGTSTQSGLNLEGDPAMTTGAVGQVTLISASDFRITSNVRGAGTYVPITLHTGGSERLRIDTSGNVGIGTTQVDGLNLRVSKGLIPGTHSGATDAYGVRVDGSIAAAATNAVRLFSTYPVTTASAFTLSTLTHYQANQGTLGAGSAVTSQYGFQVDTGMVSATNNYGFTATDIGGALATTGKTNIGFYSGLTTASGGGTAWNIYSAGTAPNYFAGNVGIGISPSYPLHIHAATGQVYLNSSTGTNYVRYSANNTGGSFQFGIDNSAGSNYFGATPYGRAIFSDGAYPLGIFTNATERIRIDSSGNVMMGTTGLVTSLTVNGGGAFYTQGETTKYNGTSNGLTLGTIDKATAPAGGGQGVIGIYSKDAVASQLQATMALITDPTGANRRLAISVIEQGTGYRNVTLAEPGGNVGIGIATPSFALHVKGSDYRAGLFETASNLGPAVQIKGSKTYELRSTNTGATEGGGLFFIFDKDNEASRLTINSGGVIAVKFAATQVASTDPNTLDDYEEGTFTPNLVNNGSSSTFTVKNGWYRKIGSQVTYWVDFDSGNSGTAGTQLQIVNLPFTFFTGPRGVQNGGFWSANSLAANTGGVNPQGTTNYANIYIGGGSVTSQATYLSATIIGMTNA